MMAALQTTTLNEQTNAYCCTVIGSSAVHSLPPLLVAPASKSSTSADNFQALAKGFEPLALQGYTPMPWSAGKSINDKAGS